MNIIWQAPAQRKLEQQIAFLIERHATAAADRLRLRVSTYITNTLATFPNTGDYLPEHDVYEVWIPKTKIVIWYRFDHEHLVIFDLWHTSQNR